MSNDIQAGLAALNEQRFIDALALFDSALRSSPGSSEARLGLASAHLGLGNFREALTSAQNAARAPTALYVLGPAAALAGDESTFAVCLDRLAALPPAQAMATAQFWSARFLEHGAIGFVRHAAAAALRAAPKDYDANIALAEALLRLGDSSAEEAAQRAISLDRKRSEAYALLAQVQLQSGNLGAARATALTAITRNRRLVPAYAALADIDPSAIDGTMCSTLAALAESESETIENRSTAGMVLAAALDARGEPNEAFARISAARALLYAQAQLVGRAYDRSRTEARVTRELQLFSAAALASPPPNAQGGEGLIFIAGMPRCGSTLVDQILAGHSQVRSAGEYAGLHAVRAAFDALAPCDADAAISKNAAAWTHAYRAGLPAAPVSIDKNLLNFWNVGLIRRLFPLARVILMRRDPIDVCFSNFRRTLVGAHDFAHSFEDLAHYHRCFATMAEHWLACAPESVLEVNYEALVDDFEGGVRRLLAHCGLSLEEACLQFENTRRPVRTASAAQVRRPLNRAGIGRWRRYERHLQPLIIALERN